MWINMLSKVPGLGLIKAKVIAQTYTCPMQLINVYNEPNLNRKFKQDLIQNLLSIFGFDFAESLTAVSSERRF